MSTRIVKDMLARVDGERERRRKPGSSKRPRKRVAKKKAKKEKTRVGDNTTDASLPPQLKRYLAKEADHNQWGQDRLAAARRALAAEQRREKPIVAVTKQVYEQKESESEESDEFS